MSIFKKLALSAAAVAAATAVPAPAFAGGGHHGYYRPYHPGYYRPAYYGGPYRGHYRHYNYRRHRGGISGGEAALIAAGIIGGVILIDRALDDRDRYDDRYRDRYDDRYDDLYRRRGAFNEDDYYYQRDDRPYEDDRYADRYDDRRDDYRAAVDPDDIDGRLLGAEDGQGRGAGRAVLADAAFRECVAETRGAAGAGGMNVAMPGAPTEVEELTDGSVRMTAQFRASNARGESWSRRFVCEADEEGVRFLQVD